MPLSWNEIRDRARRFVKTWADAHDEASHAKPFWIDFFEAFGVSDRRVATFEYAVQKFHGGRGRADLFWRGMLLVEQKSRGKDLDEAFAQAQEYLEGIAQRDLPRLVIVCDFARFRLHNLDDGSRTEFSLAQLPEKIRHFAFIAGYTPQVIREQDPVNVKAAETLGRLHDALKAAGYTGHPLEVLLVRLLFCLFADDTGIFEQQSFRELIEQRTGEDGADLGARLAELFQVLNTEPARRQKNLDPQLAAFAYVNGAVFAEPLPIAQFDSAMRQALLDCCGLNWAAISPAIFGAMFQSVMDVRARRNLGAHYTSEANILKLIKPLFLDELRAEFERVKGNRTRLLEFHQKLRRLSFLDPACGCGNFLVITYRELRLLELDVLRAAHTSGQRVLDIHRMIELNVDQFHGIEIEEFPAQIAQVALWLVDHQMNQKVAEEFGMYFARIPLVTTPRIHCGNALTTDWNTVLPAQRCSYVLGNPPFIGKQFQSAQQKADLEAVTRGIAGAGVLDFVAGWYVKAALYIDGTDARCALVATNSVTQGEQVGVLWGWLLAKGVHIHFAHRTFQWSNEARGVAAVHCVIIGFGLENHTPKSIFEYDDLAGEPHAVTAANINPYLVDAPDVVLPNRRTPICAVPPIAFGSMPNDGGHLLLSSEERTALLAAEPAAERWLRPFRGSDEFLNAVERWCLWLVDCPPNELRRMPEVAERVAAVRAHRLASSRATTQQLANTPTLFGEIRQPAGDYLAIPKTSSERRKFVPIAPVSGRVIASTELFTLPDAKLFDLGVLCSTMHNAWIRYTCGRLKSDFRYSAGIVYNNFPWPESPSDKQRAAIEAAAQGVLDARAQFPQSSLADLYDPLTMPPALVKAHQVLDAAVDAAYGRRSFRNDAERVAFLFERYQAITSLLPADKPAKRKRPPAGPSSGAPA
jgi:hypothetical protein